MGVRKPEEIVHYALGQACMFVIDFFSVNVFYHVLAQNTFSFYTTRLVSVLVWKAKNAGSSSNPKLCPQLQIAFIFNVL